MLKLYYYDYYARAEAIRMLFWYGKLEYEDIRIPKEDWPQYREDNKDKLNLEFGQIPVIEYPDGTWKCQSQAITRYYGRKLGLYPTDNPELCYEIDSQIDAIHDIAPKLVEIRDEPDVFKKTYMGIQMLQGPLPEWLGVIEKRLEAKQSNKWICGDQLTIADFWWGAFIFSSFYNDAQPDSERLRDVWEGFPNLVQYGQHMQEFMKEYLEKRPQNIEL